jgi:hypothetical protein
MELSEELEQAIKTAVANAMAKRNDVEAEQKQTKPTLIALLKSYTQACKRRLHALMPSTRHGKHGRQQR